MDYILFQRIHGVTEVFRGITVSNSRVRGGFVYRGVDQRETWSSVLISTLEYNINAHGRSPRIQLRLTISEQDIQLNCKNREGKKGGFYLLLLCITVAERHHQAVFEGNKGHHHHQQ